MQVSDVVQLAEVRDRKGRSVTANPAFFYFDLACPFSYLAAERIERLFGRVVWRPVLGEVVHRGDPWADPVRAAAARTAAERRAGELRVPLVWPEVGAGGAGSAVAAMRIASFAAERGRGARYAHAAGRLAWCGGFELDDPEVLAEAAAAAGLGLEESLHAGGDVARDGPMEAGARRLVAAGADRLPAVAVSRRLFAGELRLGEAMSASRSQPTSAAAIVPA
jgi:2-hydroxychromene-2-carboxylate isomerase